MTTCLLEGAGQGARRLHLIYLLVGQECVKAGTSRTGFVYAYGTILVSVRARAGRRRPDLILQHRIG